MENWEKMLLSHGQEHILRHMERLSEGERRALLSRLETIDWELLGLFRHPGQNATRGKIAPIQGITVSEIEELREKYFSVGAQAIRAGKVGAVMLAGGQGTRLGTDAPKGAFDIGITAPRYIFQQQICNLLDVCRTTGAYVPLFIMTSEKNDAVTRAFLCEHKFFGYPAQMVRFFMQDMAPCVDFQGRLLLERRGTLALSPNGNGGWYTSLVRADVMKDFPALEWLNVFAVDNVLQRIADPVFVGATMKSGCMSGSKVVSKCSPHEKVGVLCLEDGRPSVVEYYELPEEMANARGKDGQLTYRYGVILNYLFYLPKLQEIARARIPVHVVKKKIPCLDGEGRTVTPDTENGYKFETLILDMIRLMGNTLPFEVVREREFAPIKNREGVDSVETARELLKQNGVTL